MANRKSVANIVYNNEIQDKTKEDIERLIVDNLGLVKSIVKKFKPSNAEEFDEMTQCGRIGLWKAIKYHKPQKGKLTTVAYRHILWEILGYLRQKKSLNKKQEKIVDMPKRVYAKNEIFIEEVYPELTKEEISIINDVVSGHNRKNIALKNNMKLGQLKKLVKTIFQKIKESNE